MFSYVHTVANAPTPSEKHVLDPFVDHYLISLVNGLPEGSFGYDTIDKFAEYVKGFYSNLNNMGQKLYIDSSGYSIISGEITYRNACKLIGVYNYYFKYHTENNSNKIFSLDVPIFLKEFIHNTTEKIYDLNNRSISQSKQIMLENNNLYDYYTFVYHFKIQKQFNIWRNLYDQYFADDKNLKHFAIGGLVSLRGIANINFSPFLCPAYRILKHVYDRNLNDTSLLHILGVYHRYDRPTMYFMDKLFNNHYLKDRNSKMNITFDTVNYALTGLYKVRELPALIFNSDEDITQDYLHNIDDISHLVLNEEVRNLILEDLQNIKSNNKLNDPKLLGLLMVVYNQLIDKIMFKCFDDDNVLELFLENSGKGHKFWQEFSKLYDKWMLKYPFIFLSNHKNSYRQNFEFLGMMHLGWENGAKDDIRRIDKGIEIFIKKIGFPFDLNGEFSY